MCESGFMLGGPPGTKRPNKSLSKVKNLFMNFAT